ncbi:TPA: hypothetical protein N5L24_004182 [Enterobacter roggenkampii]|nr:hypothetical protein [Enterobacter roggenkampii]
MKYLYCVMLVTFLGLSGCSMLPQAGPLAGKDVAEIKRTIVDGKSTYSDLQAIYGDKAVLINAWPDKKVVNWYRTWSSGFAQDTTVLSVLTDKNTVTRHTVLRYKTSTDYSFVSKLSDAELKSFVTPGKTTLQEIENKFGKPNDNAFDEEDNQIVIYMYADVSNSQFGWIPNVGGYVEALAGSKKIKLNTLQFIMNSNNTVKAFSLNANNYHQGVGLLNSSSVIEDK